MNNDEDEDDGEDEDVRHHCKQAIDIAALF